MNWWEADNLTYEQQILRKTAYYNTFLATEEGRAVLIDIFRPLEQLLDADSLDSGAIATLLSLKYYIKDCCGVTDPMAVLRSEAELFEDYLPPEEPKPKAEDLHRIN